MLQVIMSLVQDDANRLTNGAAMRSILEAPVLASPTSSFSSLSCSIGSEDGFDLKPKLVSLARVPSLQHAQPNALASAQVSPSVLMQPPLQGWIASHLTCSRCEKPRPVNHQPFIDLSLPLPSTQNTPVMGARGRPIGGRQVPGLSYRFEQQGDKDVRDLLKQYVQSEDIDNVECTHCTAESYIDSYVCALCFFFNPWEYDEQCSRASSCPATA